MLLCRLQLEALVKLSPKHNRAPLPSLGSLLLCKLHHSAVKTTSKVYHVRYATTDVLTGVACISVARMER